MPLYDARDGARGIVFHVPTSKEVRLCVWVDTDSATYGVYSLRVNFFSMVQEIDTIQAKKITHPQNGLWLIDPVDDSEPEQVVEKTKELEKT